MHLYFIVVLLSYTKQDHFGFHSFGFTDQIPSLYLVQLGRFRPIISTDVGSIEALEALVSSLDHRLLGGSDPDSRVVELLVGLVSAVGVANLNMRVLVNRIFLGRYLAKGSIQCSLTCPCR